MSHNRTGLFPPMREEYKQALTNFSSYRQAMKVFSEGTYAIFYGTNLIAYHDTKEKALQMALGELINEETVPQEVISVKKTKHSIIINPISLSNIDAPSATGSEGDVVTPTFRLPK